MMNQEFRVAACSIALPEGSVADRLDFWDLEACDRILNTMEFK
jgi:hypothetical protein